MYIHLFKVRSHFIENSLKGLLSGLVFFVCSVRVLKQLSELLGNRHFIYLFRTGFNSFFLCVCVSEFSCMPG